jgi:hypothetical protein
VTVPPTVTPTTPAPAAKASSGGKSALPRDGLVVLVGILVAGLAVSVRAIRVQERRIGWALLGFCLVYLVVLGGLVSGVAGAAPAPPGDVTATAGDGQILVSFDPPLEPGATVSLARDAGRSPSSCVDPSADETLTLLNGPIVEVGLANGTTYHYAVCTDDGTGQSASVAVSATPTSGVVVVPPVTHATASASKRSVTVSWTNPGGIFDHAIVIRKVGSRPTSLTDGVLIADGSAHSVIDHPLSTTRVWFAIFAADSEDTLADPVYTSVARFDPWLRAPYDGQVVGRRPAFQWKHHRGDYYNIQIFKASRSGRPVNPSKPLVNAHPKKEHYTSRKLARGRYVWYVWAHTGGPHFFAYGSQVFTVH